MDGVGRKRGGESEKRSDVELGRKMKMGTK